MVASHGTFGAIAAIFWFMFSKEVTDQKTNNKNKNEKTQKPRDRAIRSYKLIP